MPASSGIVSHADTGTHRIAVAENIVHAATAAHNLVQQYEDDATAAWIHAVLHKIESDLGDARYWYRRADRMNHVEGEPREELVAIQTELRSHCKDG